VPVGVDDEAVVELDDQFQIPKKPPMFRRHGRKKLVDRRFAGAPGGVVDHRIVHAVALQRVVHALFDKPFEGGHRIDRRGVERLALAVENEVEDVVVIATDEAGVGQFQQQVDDAARFRAAVDVIAGEDELGVGVLDVDEVEQHLQRAQHAVNVAYDPAHWPEV
jgi:hypothetical protein